MIVKCEECGKQFMFIIENEYFSDIGYNYYDVSCPKCEIPIIIWKFMELKK